MYPQPKMPNSSCQDLHFSKYHGLILGFACNRNAAKLLAATILTNKLLNFKFAKYKRKNTEIKTIRGETLLIQTFPKNVLFKIPK